MAANVKCFERMWSLNNRAQVIRRRKAEEPILQSCPWTEGSELQASPCSIIKMRKCWLHKRSDCPNFPPWWGVRLSKWKGNSSGGRRTSSLSSQWEWPKHQVKGKATPAQGFCVSQNKSKAKETQVLFLRNNCLRDLSLLFSSPFSQTDLIFKPFPPFQRLGYQSEQ